ncbi:DUF4270 domain-containing protein [Neolewinella aurantiaca]|uniref:DUF4270 domain-containing protein n=1 Tax=Neolewinella aurantiaca TaxID=2602767 RepID=A0A5C7FVV8_9BACT|nr:DUF4270 family protein [Neolewinella aurantiaca]TXF90787.1 DUF4270 domain-containing protein [Neolewinella aurantiaca]
MKQIIFYLSCTVFFVLTACTDPITVGSDLLGDDRAVLGQTTDIPFTTRVVENDSLFTYDALNFICISGMSFGELQDDVFGATKHSFYAVPALVRSSTTGLPAPPPFAYTARNVDSVVLIMPIDTAYDFYGTAREFNFRAGLIPTRVDDDVDYYSNLMLADGEDVNDGDLITATRTETLLYDTLYATNNDSIVASHIRFKFDQEFLDQVNLRDEATFDSDSALATLLAGVYLETENDPDGLLGLKPFSTLCSSTISGFYFFYKDTSETMTERFYRMPLALALPRYEKDYTGSLVGNLLGDGDDLEQIALSGQGGVMTEITFPDLSMLEDKVINQAEMLFFRETIEDYSYETYPGPAYVALFYRNDEGNLVQILDRQLLVNSDFTSVVNNFLGGNELTDDDGNVFYRPRFSVHLQQMVEGEVPPTIYMRVFPVDRDPGRVILSGPEAAERPATIKVTFTEVGG